jgi:hypothetical protein
VNKGKWEKERIGSGPIARPWVNCCFTVGWEIYSGYDLTRLFATRPFSTACVPASCKSRHRREERSYIRVPPFISEELVRSTIRLRGEAGAEWLKRLPGLIVDCERRWRIEVGPPFSGLWINWVAPADCADGTPVVLKLCFPEDREFRTEAEALRQFGRRGVARLLQLDLHRGAMLLERCEPGVPLSSVEDDEQATSIAAEVMKRLWRPVPDDHSFPLVSDWA